MILAHLIGGNEIEGISEGVVIVNGEELETSYSDLVEVCGNISLGDLDTSTDLQRDEDDVEQDYIKLVEDLGFEGDAEQFVRENSLTKQICYSKYQIDPVKKTLKLEADTY